MSDGGFRLNFDISLVAVDIKPGPVGIVNLPDDGDCDLNRVANLVVDFDFVALHIVGRKGHVLFFVEGINEEHPVVFNCAHVLATEGQDSCLVWVHCKNAAA